MHCSASRFRPAIPIDPAQAFERRELVLGRSLYEFMQKLGMKDHSGGAHGERTRLKNQIRQLFRCGISFVYTDGAIDLHILKAVKRSPLGLDLYLWLTYRTFTLKSPLRLSWKQLYRQFGADLAAVLATCHRARPSGRRDRRRRSGAAPARPARAGGARPAPRSSRPNVHGRTHGAAPMKLTRGRATTAGRVPAVRSELGQRPVYDRHGAGMAQRHQGVRRRKVMRLRNFLVVAIGLAVLLAVGERAEAQEMGQVIEEIEDLQAEQLDVLRTLAEESEADAEETPDDAPARALAELDRGTVDVVARAHEEMLEKLREVRREGNWEQAYPLLRLLINDGRPGAIVRALRDQAEAELERAQAQLEQRRALREQLPEQRAQAEKWRAARAAEEATAEARTEELVTAAPARRAELEDRLASVEKVYEDIFAVHEEAAQALTDMFEQRWALDRIPTDRTMMEFEVGLARQHLERATDVELDGVEASVKEAEAGAAYRLTQARAALDTARGK